MNYKDTIKEIFKDKTNQPNKYNFGVNNILIPIT
jgi:hypothetical protein